MEITNELAVAMLAGAKGIRTNRKCDETRYVLDPCGKNLQIGFDDAADALIIAAAEVLGLKLKGKPEPTTNVCNATGRPCSKCQMGPCGIRKEDKWQSN